MKIYIVGTGGVGGYFGGLLARSGEDVTFVARNDNFTAITNNGLKVRSVKSGNFVVKPAKVIDSISKIKDPDLVLITTKTYDNNEVSKALSKVVNQKTVVITFQNGVNNDINIKKQIKAGKVHPGVAYVISVKTNPGIIEQKGGLCKLIFGDRKIPNNKSLQKIESLMKNSGLDAELSNDIQRDLWKKFVFISAFSGMTALTRSPIQMVLNDKLTKNLYERCVKESISVAKAMKVNLPKDIFKTVMHISTVTSPDSKSSLLVDVENGNKNEIETLNGTIVRYAEKLKIDAPINKTIYSAIKLLQIN
jgi:2-dehydropantoate 2-reductase